MADLTKIELVDLVLQHLGVLGAGQSASPEDADLVSRAIDSAHSMLRKFGLVPFDTSAIPDWAQDPLRDYVSGRVSVSFGLRDQVWQSEMRRGEIDLGRQIAGFRHSIPIVADYF